MYRKNDKYLFGLSNVRASSPAGFKPKKRMTTHENNGIQGAISKKAEPIQDLPFFLVFKKFFIGSVVALPAL
jgi:hypothetical protein